MIERDTNPYRNISLDRFEEICLNGLRLDTDGVNESGSAGNAIVDVLTTYYGMKPDSAVQKMKDLEKRAGFKRGLSR